jgi:hypothetical protein
LSQQEQIPIAIVGGLAAIHFGYPAVTEDIDVAIAKNHLSALLAAASKYGFKIAWEAESGWHTLIHGDVEINIVPEGEKARNSSPTTIPGPVQLGVESGLDYASLSGWLELKISSNRQKDRAHIVEVLKQLTPQQIQNANEHLAAVHPAYLAAFGELAVEAEAEKQQEQQRGNRGGR